MSQEDLNGGGRDQRASKKEKEWPIGVWVPRRPPRRVDRDHRAGVDRGEVDRGGGCVDKEEMYEWDPPESTGMY